MYTPGALKRKKYINNVKKCSKQYIYIYIYIYMALLGGDRALRGRKKRRENDEKTKRNNSITDLNDTRTEITVVL